MSDPGGGVRCRGDRPPTGGVPNTGDDPQMQYLVSVIADSATARANPDEEAAIDAFNERLQADGHWVFAGGLGGPDTATVIDNRGDAAVITDGPFVESKEYL